MHWIEERRLFSALAVALALSGPVVAWAQQAPAPAKPVLTPGTRGKPAVSPVDPGDLTKPAFDTTTSDYSTLSGQARAATTVVADVEGTTITLADVRDAIAALPASQRDAAFDDLYPNVLEKLVKEQALVVQARRRGVDELAEFRRKARALADVELANQFMRQVLGQRVTEQMVLARYDRDIAGKPGAIEVRPRLIQVETQEKANEVLGKIRAGEDFATLARQFSKDQTASQGGDAGFVPMDVIVPQVAGVLSALAPGQVAPIPLRTSLGWYVVKLEERRNKPTPTFAEVHDSLKENLIREAVPDFAEEAQKGLTIRRYGFTGPGQGVNEGAIKPSAESQ